MSPHHYTRDHVIRDIVYFFHLCAQYHGLPTDAALYGSVLSVSYEQYFEGDDPHDPEDRLIREGSLLILLGMLDDWDAGASHSFAEISPGGHASLTAYLAALLRAYAHAREQQDERITFLCEKALALLARIERRGHWARPLGARTGGRGSAGVGAHPHSDARVRDQPRCGALYAARSV